MVWCSLCTCKAWSQFFVPQTKKNEVENRIIISRVAGREGRREGGGLICGINLSNSWTGTCSSGMPLHSRVTTDNAVFYVLKT